VSELISKILFCLLMAAAIGFLTAWFLRRLSILELTDEKNSLRRKLTSKELATAEAERKATNLDTQLQLYETEIAAERTKFEQSALAARSQYDAAQIQLGKFSADITTKDASIASLGAIIAMRENSLRESDKNLAAAKLTFASYETKLHELQQTLLDKDSLLRARDENLRLREVRINELETQAGTYMREIGKVQGELQNSQNSLAANLKGKDSEIARLTAQIAPLATMTASMGTKDNKIKELESHVSQLTSEITQQKSNAAKWEREMQAARVQAQTATAEAITYKQRADQASNDQRGKLDHYQAMEREYDAMKKSFANRTQLLTDAQTASEQSKRDLLQCQANNKALEQQVQQLKASQAQALAASIAASKQTQSTLPRQMAKTPAYKDDIKHIYGVGPALEIELNRLGVYFFRQVSLWSEQDIDFFDAQLPDFKGRIRRENWVRSAVEEHYKKYGEWLASGNPAITIAETNRS
jgi:predicted flap endonuclease-1-like 5' DNA nuclease/flagellar biosynthesis chaperone FliJ